MSTIENPAVDNREAAKPSARRSTAQVVVSVGTDHHRFDRLVSWVDEWRDLHPEVITVVQSGTSSPSRHGDSRRLIPHDELLELFRRALVVVSHGGPSTIMDARMVGRMPIVLARNPAFSEHVDQHQMEFADHLERHGVAVVVRDRDGLFAAIDRAMDDPEAFTVSADHESAVGVIEFARAVDRLIGTKTPVESDLGRPSNGEPGAPLDPAGPSDLASTADESSAMPAVDRRSTPAVDPLAERRKDPQPDRRRNDP